MDDTTNDTSMLGLTYETNFGTQVFTSIDCAAFTKPELENFWNIESIEVTDEPNVKDDEVVMETFGNTLKFED